MYVWTSADATLAPQLYDHRILDINPPKLGVKLSLANQTLGSLINPSTSRAVLH